MKALIAEAGSTDMDLIMQTSERVASASIAYAELRAALAAALWRGRIAMDQRDERMRTLEKLWDRIAEIPLDRPLIRRAGDLAEHQRLRGYAAVHLAALQAFGAPGDVTFACWDEDLRRAARGLGYSLLPA
jgi:predicted nucleic acid-binding protein